MISAFVAPRRIMSRAMADRSCVRWVVRIMQIPCDPRLVLRRKLIRQVGQELDRMRGAARNAGNLNAELTRINLDQRRPVHFERAKRPR
jgi:hypothetical protein